MNNIRVLVVAEDPLVRAGLAALLTGQPGCTVAGQIDGHGDLTEAIQVYRPDVLLWDLGWDPAVALEAIEDGHGVTRAILALLPDESHAAAAWMAGVRGLLMRDAELDRLVAAFSAVAQGLAVLDPILTTGLISTRDQGTAGSAEDLTPRELQVLRLMAEGLPNKTIALRLGISEHTVKFHINAILGKLGAQSRTEAVVRATRRGLILL